MSRFVSLWLQAKNFRPVAFYPYTSRVADSFVSQNFNYKTDEHDILEAFGNAMQKKVEALGVKWDNKVVIELEYTPIDLRTDIMFKASHLFIGKADGRWSLGFAMMQDPWLEEVGANKYFTYTIEVKGESNV